jgi:hypothetical protein
MADITISVDSQLKVLNLLIILHYDPLFIDLDVMIGLENKIEL